MKRRSVHRRHSPGWRRFWHLIRSFMRKMSNDRIDVYSAQASFYLVMSLMPMLMMAAVVLKYTPFTEDVVLSALSTVLQADALEFVSSYVSEMYRGSSAVATFTLLVMFWTAGKGVMGLSKGLNTIYHQKEKRSYLFLRLRSSLYTVLLVFALVFSMVILVVMTRLNEYLGQHYPALQEHGTLLRYLTILCGLPLLTTVFLFLYMLLPCVKKKMRTQIWGAVFTTAAWCVFTELFLLYLKVSKNLSLVYGSLLTIMMAIMWLYWCLYLFFFGAELNAWIENPDSFPF